MPRHKFQPTEEQRRKVKTLAGYGVRQREIAALLSLTSTTTLRKHFKQELRLGAVEAKAQMLGTLFKLAHSGRDPTLTMFWLKTRARWSEKGNAEESVKRSERDVWQIIVHQPPRRAEHHEVEAGLQDAQEPSEWEEVSETA